MSEIKDPAIKLFGRTIPLLESQIPAEEVEKHDDVAMIEAAEDEDVCLETVKGEVQNPSPCVSEDPGLGELDSFCGLNNHQDRQGPPTNGDKTVAGTNPEEDPAETETASQEKVLKKPDKILPCPRCNSLDTKFCYYNNYNVNQPRHFCKNCQRYWTAGGTMRNVPVGAGRRKNKHSPSHYRHIIISSDGIPTPGVDTPDTSRHQVLSAPIRPHKGNGGVIKFGPDTPLCESMATVLNLADQKLKIEVGSLACGESGEEHSCGSSVTASTCRENELPEKNVGQMERGGLLTGCHNGIAPPPHMPCYPGPPWPYPWNLQWNNVAAMVAAPAFCAPSILVPFVPPSYWGCLPGWAGGPWNMSWVGSNNGLSPPSSSTSNSGCSGNDSPTLGKHSRDATIPGEEKGEKFLWVPKTLRIDDPDEASKSSIWATLGIKNDRNEPITKGGMFKAFQSKTEGKGHTSDSTQVLHANPAALSRSQTFQESTT